MSEGKAAGNPAVHVALRGVAKRFPARPAARRCMRSRPIDLDIRQGEFFAVVGPSGCGKSTLLELIAGLLPATEGRIEFEGRPIGDEVPDGIGVVFQEDACFPWLCVRDNVAFGLRRSALDTDEKDARVNDAIAMMGLADFASHLSRRSFPAACASASASRARW